MVLTGFFFFRLCLFVSVISHRLLQYVYQNDGSKFQFADLIIYTLIIDALSLRSLFVLLFYFSGFNLAFYSSIHIAHYLIKFMFVDFSFIQFHFSTPIGIQCSQAII